MKNFDDFMILFKIKFIELNQNQSHHLNIDYNVNSYLIQINHSHILMNVLPFFMNVCFSL